MGDRILQHILVRDAAAGVVIVNKPAGLAATGRTLDDPDCVHGQLMAALRRRRVWAVHQLDKDTSGVLLFVLRKALVADYAARLGTPGAKTYLAVCHGELARACVVEEPIGRRGRFPAISAQGRPATTHITPLASHNGYCLVRCEPRTGRTHQIRLHLAHLGHPLVGEKLHRVPPCERHRRHALHAIRLVLGAPLGEVEAPVPADLRLLCAELGLALPESCLPTK